MEYGPTEPSLMASNHGSIIIREDSLVHSASPCDHSKNRPTGVHAMSNAIGLLLDITHTPIGRIAFLVEHSPTPIGFRRDGLI